MPHKNSWNFLSGMYALTNQSPKTISKMQILVCSVCANIKTHMTVTGLLKSNIVKSTVKNHRLQGNVNEHDYCRQIWTT